MAIPQAACCKIFLCIECYSADDCQIAILHHVILPSQPLPHNANPTRYAAAPKITQLRWHHHDHSVMIRAAANVHLTPCTLELGGKSPTYFDDSGDLEVTTIIIIIIISIVIVIIIIFRPDQSEKASLGKVQQLWSNLRCSRLHPLFKSRRRVIVLH